MELVSLRWRLLLGMFYNAAYAIGYMALSGIAIIFKDYVHTELACLVPTLLFTAIYM